MSGTFFTFPLCLLAMTERPEKRRLQLIISHAIERAGVGSPQIGDERIGQYIGEHKLTKYNSTQRHNDIIRGAIVCGVNIHDVANIVRECDEATTFVSYREGRYGRDPLVFIATDLFWGCHDRDDPCYRDFTAICAINSIVGFKKFPVLIRRSMITARQLGFKTPAIMAAELGTQPKLSAPHPLTTRQLRTTLNHLEQMDLIRRYQASRTCVYFSTTLAYDELKKAVQDRKATKNMVAIRRMLERGSKGEGTNGGPSEGHLKRNSPKEGEKGPLKNGSPNEGQAGAKIGAKIGPR